MIDNLPRYDLWNYLKAAELPILIYGMGNGADKIIAQLEKRNINVSDIFASDEFVRGHSFHGMTVIKYSQICEKYDKAIILVCFGSSLDSVLQKFDIIKEKYELYAPDVPVFGDNLFDMEFYLKNKERFEEVYQSLADDFSRKVYADLIAYKLSGDIEYLKQCETHRIEDINSLIRPSDCESFLDLGAYNGDTVKEFANITDGHYRRIIAVEPDTRTYKKLCLNTFDNTVFLNVGVGDKDEDVMFSNKSGRMSSVGLQKGILTRFMTVESICKDNNFAPTYIKMDVEGEEARALNGAAKTLLKYKPKMLVSAYHRSEDLFELPLLVKKLNPEYKLYFRKNKYVPAWDINLYCV